MKKIIDKIFDAFIKSNSDITYMKIRNKLKKKSSTFMRFYYKFKLIKILRKNGAYIPSSTEIGEGVCFPHGLFGIFISQGAKIGKNCVIFHQVTIGSNTLSDSSKKGSPTIGDNCYIGAGAKIIGNIVVGDNVRIGANCVVVTDIPSNSTVVNQKPRIIEKNNEINSFINVNELNK